MRKYLERRAKEKEQEEKEKAEQEKIRQAAEAANAQQLQSPAVAAADDKSVSTQSSKKKKFWGRSKRKEEENEEEINEADLYHSPRPAFYAHTRPSRRTQVPRDVAVPYFRFRKDRFYDWPPDPTVSRATPLLAEAETDSDYMDSSKHQKKKRKDADDEYDGYEEDQPRGVRRRNKAKARDDYGY